MSKIFWYHYNKPASKAAGKPQLTIHYDKQCIIVDRIHCAVSTWSHNRKSQPHCVIKGRGNVEIINNMAFVRP